MTSGRFELKLTGRMYSFAPVNLPPHTSWTGDWPRGRCASWPATGGRFTVRKMPKLVELSRRRTPVQLRARNLLWNPLTLLVFIVLVTRMGGAQVANLI